MATKKLVAKLVFYLSESSTYRQRSWTADLSGSPQKSLAKFYQIPLFNPCSENLLLQSRIDIDLNYKAEA